MLYYIAYIIKLNVNNENKSIYLNKKYKKYKCVQALDHLTKHLNANSHNLTLIILIRF